MIPCAIYKMDVSFFCSLNDALVFGIAVGTFFSKQNGSSIIQLHSLMCKIIYKIIFVLSVAQFTGH